MAVGDLVRGQPLGVELALVGERQLGRGAGAVAHVVELGAPVRARVHLQRHQCEGDQPGQVGEGEGDGQDPP
jgi:hypothetical protein